MPFWVKINGVPTRVNSLSNQVPVADASVTALSQSVTASFAAEAAARTSAINSSITVLSGNVVSSFVAEAAARTSAINSSVSGLASQTYVNNKITDLVNSAPATLDTLKELADALGSDANFSTTVTNQIASYSGSLANSITALSQSVTASFAAETTARTSAINAAVSNLASQTYVDNKVTGLVTQAYVDNLVSGSGNFARSWFMQSSGSQSSAGSYAYVKLLDLPFYVTSSNSDIAFDANWIVTANSIGSYGFHITIDGNTITSSYNGVVHKNAANASFSATTGGTSAGSTISFLTSSLSVGWHTASLVGMGQNSWSTNPTYVDANWKFGYYTGARLRITEFVTGSSVNSSVVNVSSGSGNVTWFTATSAQTVVSANVATKILNLPFYVSSSNSNIIIDYNWSGVAGNGSACTNYSHLYLDGVKLNGSVYMSTPHANMYTTLHDTHIVTASVGWHTASLEIKNDLTTLTLDWNTNKQRAIIKVTEEKK